MHFLQNRTESFTEVDDHLEIIFRGSWHSSQFNVCQRLTLAILADYANYAKSFKSLCSSFHFYFCGQNRMINDFPPLFKKFLEKKVEIKKIAICQSVKVSLENQIQP